MNCTKKSLAMAILGSSLAGCASFSDNNRLCADAQGEFYACQDLPVTAALNTEVQASLYSTPMNFQLLNEYTEQMAADLQSDLIGQKIKGVIIVSSFVYLDSTLRSTNKLGNQLAEFFIHDLQEIGLPVSEHRLAEFLTVNASGDFALTREQEEIIFEHDAAYVLVGTMVENNRGLIINTRLVSVKNREVLASASKFLPTALFSGL